VADPKDESAPCRLLKPWGSDCAYVSLVVRTSRSGAMRVDEHEITSEVAPAGAARYRQ